MKTVLLFLGCSLTAALPLHSETLFGPGTISIGTNETILIRSQTDVGGIISWGSTILLDGFDVTPLSGDVRYYGNSVFALSGPHVVQVRPPPVWNPAWGNGSNDFFITFQRLTNSPIKTVLTAYGTNFIDVPSGKTIEFFYPFSSGREYDVALGRWNYPFHIQPANATDWYTLDFYEGITQSPAVTGPATVRIVSRISPHALSYYFTDELVQFPPRGLLSVPAPVLQVGVEKSYDLTNWTSTAVFHTEAEAGAFYRLRMLK